MAAAQVVATGSASLQVPAAGSAHRLRTAANALRALQGIRSSNEDTLLIVPRMEVPSGAFMLAGVFDGHGGARCAAYIRDNLPRHLERELKEKAPEKALEQAFLDIDGEFLGCARDGPAPRALGERASDCPIATVRWAAPGPCLTSAVCWAACAQHASGRALWLDRRGCAR
jgi:hypothetical protein